MGIREVGDIMRYIVIIVVLIPIIVIYYICLYDGIITYYVDIMRYMTGWWYTYPSEKYEFVNWDHEIPNMEK
jgi:hypothetical protein